LILLEATLSEPGERLTLKNDCFLTKYSRKLGHLLRKGRAFIELTEHS